MTPIDRFWLLTWTCYGTWLPGDKRGFVSPRPDGHGELVLHNIPGTPYDEDEPELERMTRSRLAGPPISLNQAQSDALHAQFLETAEHRQWRILAGAIMRNHVHLVVGVALDPAPSKVLHSFKAYGSRALNKTWARPESDTWWTESGSKRKLDGETSVLSGVLYVWNQEYPLVVWTHPCVEGSLGDLSSRSDPRVKT